MTCFLRNRVGRLDLPRPVGIMPDLLTILPSRVAGLSGAGCRGGLTAQGGSDSITAWGGTTRHTALPDSFVECRMRLPHRCRPAVRLQLAGTWLCFLSIPTPAGLTPLRMTFSSCAHMTAAKHGPQVRMECGCGQALGRPPGQISLQKPQMSSRQGNGSLMGQAALAEPLALLKI